MKHIAIVDNATGLVVGEWSGGDEQTIAVQAGQIHVPVSGRESVAGLHWGGLTFDLVAPPVPMADPLKVQLDRIEAAVAAVSEKLPPL